MFEVTLADGRTVLAAAYGPEDLALILRGTGAHIDVHEKITDPNAHIFKTSEAVTMRQALRITALEALVAKQNESKHLDGLNSDFAALHERLMGALTISLADRVVAAGAVFALMRIQNALNSSPKWDADTLEAVAAQVRAAMTYKFPTKKQAERFQKNATDRLIRLGFKKVEGGPRDFCLDTPLGQLWASLYDDWIACHFDNLELAKQHLPHGYYDRLNKFSGKWNWHGDGLDADGYTTEMLNKFEAAVSQILAMKTAHQLPGDAEPGA